MKKFLSILAIAGVMVACNNGDDDTNGVDTNSTEWQDSAKKARAGASSSTVVTPKTDTVKNAKGGDSLYIRTSADGKVDTVKVGK